MAAGSTAPAVPFEAAEDPGTGEADRGPPGQQIRVEESPYRLCRPDTAAEWDAYHLIRRDVLLESREHAFAHPDADEELAPRHFPLLFWQGERPIGTIRVDCLDGGFAALRLVAVDPVCQARGHGRRLLQAAEQFARNLGCRTAVVYATLEAAGFYACSGYVEECWDDCAVGGIVQMTKGLV